MNLNQLNNVPFHSWDCITLILEGREVNLVITDMHDMNDFLKFLINKMRTLDGTKDTANKILAVMNK